MDTKEKCSYRFTEQDEKGKTKDVDCSVRMACPICRHCAHHCPRHIGLREHIEGVRS